MENKNFEEEWELLKQVGSTDTQKEAIRKRIQGTILNQPSKTRGFQFHPWKSIIAASLLIVILGGSLFMLIEDHPLQNPTSSYTIDNASFSWKLDDVTSEKAGGKLELYHKNNPIPFGTVTEVTEKEMNTTIKSKSMFVERELENFPYKSNMYIEHVKMQDVVIRYYFFVPMTAEKWIQFTFDYPKLEYAEIFRAMSTLELKEKKPYHSTEQLYVNHGYGSMIYPVEIESISITANNIEVYRWEGASTKEYNQYVMKLLQNRYWKQESRDGLSSTFASVDGNEVITITLNGNELTYEYFYPNHEE
ncbi:hypothetical protein ACIQXV_09225 [Neobacillus sp. NPDC097160]|uniref:hypothetical protein n=1 Tax=Neobacillus sp. NPDC097160 TaxID=3364298 RepID=UPI00381869F3